MPIPQRDLRWPVVCYVLVASFFVASFFARSHLSTPSASIQAGFFLTDLKFCGLCSKVFVWPSATRLRQKTTQSVRRVTVASCKRQDNASNSGKSRERELHASAASCVAVDLFFVLLVAQSTWLKLGCLIYIYINPS